MAGANVSCPLGFSRTPSFVTSESMAVLTCQLKLAIDNALLPGHSPALLASYLQVLIMSEGDTWLHKAVYDLTLLLRASLGSTAPDRPRPVREAETMVRRFCTKELRGVASGVADVEEYIANAALDLVLMGVWSIAAGQADFPRLPVRPARPFESSESEGVRPV